MADFDEQDLLQKISELTNFIGQQFFSFSFDDPAAVNSLMEKIVTTATTHPAPSARSLAFDCLPKIASLHYDKLAPYMNHVAQASFQALQQEDNDEILLSVIELWSTVCEIETDRNMSGQPHHNFVASGAPHLIPALFNLLVKMNNDKAQDVEFEGLDDDFDEDDSPDIYNVSGATLTLIGLVSVCIKDNIASILIPILEQNVVAPDWPRQHAAIMAFGGVIESGGVTNFISNFMPILINNLSSPQAQLRDAAAWTLRRATQVYPETAAPHLASLMPPLLNALGDKEYAVAVTACNVIYNIAHAKLLTSKEMVEATVQALLRATEREVENKGTFRTATLDALAEVLRFSPDEYVPQAIALFQNVLQKLGEAIPALTKLENDVDGALEFVGGLCAVTGGIVQRLGGQGVAPYADAIFDLVARQLLSSTSVSNHDIRMEALICIQSLVKALGQSFSKYLPQLFTVLLQYIPQQFGISAFADTFELITTLCQNVGAELVPFGQPIVYALLEALKNSELDFEARSWALTCLGDFAIAVGPNFQPYFDVVMTVLNSAAEACVDLLLPNDPASLDDEAVENRNWLTRGACQAYAGIITALPKTPEARRALAPHLHMISRLINGVSMAGDIDVEVAVAIVNVMRSLLSGPVPDSISAGTAQSDLPPTLKQALLQTHKILEEVASIGGPHLTNAQECKGLIEKLTPHMP